MWWWGYFASSSFQKITVREYLHTAFIAWAVKGEGFCKSKRTCDGEAAQPIHHPHSPPHCTPLAHIQTNTSRAELVTELRLWIQEGQCAFQRISGQQYCSREMDYLSLVEEGWRVFGGQAECITVRVRLAERRKEKAEMLQSESPAPVIRSCLTHTLLPVTFISVQACQGTLKIGAIQEGEFECQKGC